ncbi:hypothetical protein HPB51_029600 [Rhipicephalus microplus]|uniref:Dedicator of cytokinesis N-terminal domain-containing protein n=1 Tax=Rhipicephalus microplus TaxID=6941 RepID=A0A9J6CU37_RHIMP|nr:hypothetical protein HPB51_029600 [Rhipicephalus microplus]
MGQCGLIKDLDQLNNLRVLFTDLGSRDLSRERVNFICQIIRIGTGGEQLNYDRRRRARALSFPSGREEKPLAVDPLRTARGKIRYSFVGAAAGRRSRHQGVASVEVPGWHKPPCPPVCLGLTSQQQRVTTPGIEQRFATRFGRPRAAQPRSTPATRQRQQASTPRSHGEQNAVALQRLQDKGASRARCPGRCAARKF